jgi:hypothetical protein
MLGTAAFIRRLPKHTKAYLNYCTEAEPLSGDLSM